MTLKNKNPWKLLSIGLLGVIAIGLLTPIDAAKPPDLHQTIIDFLNLNIDDTMTSRASQTSVDDVDSDVAGVQTTSDKIFDALTFVDSDFLCFQDDTKWDCINECLEGPSIGGRVIDVLDTDGLGEPAISETTVVYDSEIEELTTFTILCLRT